MNTEKKRAFLINIAYFGVMIALAFLAVQYLLPIVLPFVIAFIIAYFLQRPSTRWSRSLVCPINRSRCWLF